MTKQPRSDICSLSLSLESFTFLGGRMEREALPGMEEDVNPLEGSAFPLAQAQVGDHLCIAGFKGDAHTMQHLNHLGFYPGAAVQVISRSLSGSVIVTMAGKRLGLGRQTAQQVIVCKG
jgi:Fe2+ transport system protein FeoA